MLMPAAATISSSASAKGACNDFASRRPTELLPAPISPTSTTERGSAAALWGVIVAGANSSEASIHLELKGCEATDIRPPPPGRATHLFSAAPRRSRNPHVLEG